MSFIDTTNYMVNFEYLCNQLPSPILESLELCALPHVVDDYLGYSIIHDFANHNGTSRRIWAEIKQLPFVYQYEGNKWRFDGQVRDYFVSRLEKRNGTYIQLSEYLEILFNKKKEAVKDKNNPLLRELEWQVAYHLAPVTPKLSITKLCELGEKAARANRSSDIKSVVDLFEEQSKWLSGFEIEKAYFEGRYAYTNMKYIVAEQKFLSVWDKGVNGSMKVLAGHLLGVIWFKRNSIEWINKAEQILRKSLTIGKEIEDKYNLNP